MFNQGWKKIKRPAVLYPKFTRVRDITRSASARSWEGDRFDVRPKPPHSLYLLLLFQMRVINSMNRKNAMAPKKGLVVGYVVWLGFIKGMGRRTCARFAGLVPCCGQNGYRAKVLQHPIETQHNIYPSARLEDRYYSTRMTTFMKTKFNKSDDQTNIDNIELLLTWIR